MKNTLILLLVLVSCLASQAQITEQGLASFYDDKFNGRITASGELFDQSKLTAAHRTFPFGTRVAVTNINNKKTVELIINDRGPYVKDRIIDVSKKAAQELGFVGKGTANVKVEVIKLGDSTPIAASQKQKAKEPEKKESETKKTEAKKTAGETVTYNAEPQQASKGTVAAEALEYFMLDSKQIEPMGFGIQVASYQEASNLIKRCSEIKSLTTKDVIVQVGDSQGKKVYRIIIGTFATRELADDFLKSNETKFQGGFVFGF
jgi:rare lipoprotein A